MKNEKCVLLQRYDLLGQKYTWVIKDRAETRGGLQWFNLPELESNLVFELQKKPKCQLENNVNVTLLKKY